MEAFAYFPALVYRDERPDLAEAVLSDCVQQLNAVRNPVYGLCQSSNLQHIPAFRQICDYLLTTSVGILREQGYDTNKYDFYLSGLWAQEIANGSGTNVHLHKSSQISGWLFLETPSSCAYPIYYDTRANKPMIELDFQQGDDITNATSAVHFDNPHPGSVFFANSWMPHQLTGSQAESPTRCLHFIVSHRERLCSTC